MGYKEHERFINLSVSRLHPTALSRRMYADALATFGVRAHGGLCNVYSPGFPSARTQVRVTPSFIDGVFVGGRADVAAELSYASALLKLVSEWAS